MPQEAHPQQAREVAGGPELAAPDRPDTGDPSVGRVIGTTPATPLQFWLALGQGRTLQLDDVVATQRTLPGVGTVRISGIVSDLQAVHEGLRFASDVFLTESGVLPGEVSEVAQITVTRVEPEYFVPPLPGSAVRRAEGEERDEALFFDSMERRLPAGLSREGEPVFINLDFLDGTRGAHVNISGISGVATKTTYATFLLYSLFNAGILGAEALNTKALIFNVKGEDLMFLDRQNRRLDEHARSRYRSLGLSAGPFTSAGFFAPPKRGSTSAAPDVATRTQGVRPFFWTLADFCAESLLPFLFADAEDDSQQYTMVVHNVAAKLRRDAAALADGGISIDGSEVRTFRDLVAVIGAALDDDHVRQDWAGPAVGQGTIGAFMRRLYNAIKSCDRLIRGDVAKGGGHRVSLENQVTVVDIHNLDDRAKRFVVGVVVRRAFEDKERSGQSRPLLFLVLDELNKYAPRQGSSPIKEILLDIAERGRSLGIVLMGAQQTASQVEERIVGQSSIRVTGRLDSAEAEHGEYGFLRGPQRQRATIMKPGTMLLSQPDIPIPLLLEFPFPAWATRPDEAAAPPGEDAADPFAGLA